MTQIAEKMGWKSFSSANAHYGRLGQLIGKQLGFKIRPYYELPASIFLFLILVVFSKFWLARHRYGPLERIWRSFTLWQWKEITSTS